MIMPFWSVLENPGICSTSSRADLAFPFASDNRVDRRRFIGGASPGLEDERKVGRCFYLYNMYDNALIIFLCLEITRAHDHRVWKIGLPIHSAVLEPQL